MKINRSNKSSQTGSVLLLTVVFTGIMGFVLASYLTLVGAQNRSVVRSQTWNATIPLIEAGIEEAMGHLNENGLTNLFTQGWRKEYGYALRRRRVGEGRYTVAITPTTRPLIECTGFLPATMAFSASDQVQFAQTGTTIIKKQLYVARTVRVEVGGGALFAKGMVAKDAIDMNGNNVATDSFDSVDSNFSTGGQYDGTKRKDNGDVATNSREAGIFNAGNANIMGKVGTGPGGSIQLNNGSIGSLAWVLAGNPGIQADYFSDDMNISFPEINAPFSGGFSPAAGMVNETNISYGLGEITVPNLPDPLPAGPITTNYSLMVSQNYPDFEPYGGVTTNELVINATVYPTNAIGTITTNVMTITTNSLPDALPPFVASIVTNTIWVTNSVLPDPLPAGTIYTNAVAATMRYPLNPMPAAPPTPPPHWTPPEPGTFVGDVTNRYVVFGRKADRGWWHDYAAIQSYAFLTKSYTIKFSESYTYKVYEYTYRSTPNYTYLGPTSTNLTVTTTAYDLVLDSRDYSTYALSGRVYVRGNARLLVTGSIGFTGKEGITIGPNGSLELYMSGASAAIGGNGIINKSGLAKNFLYYGLPGNTSITMQGNGQFIGAIYAPYANLKIGGGGNDIQDFVGATVTASVFMNGHFNFHYDEDLARRGPRVRYTIKSWNEVGSDDATILKNPEWALLDEGEVDDFINNQTTY